MMDLALTPDGELMLDENGDLAFVEGHAEVIQAVLTTLKVMPGEWWLDPELGFLDVDTFFPENKEFSPARGSSAVRRKIGSIKGVARLTNISVTQSDDRSEILVEFDCYSIYSTQPTSIQEALGS